MTTKNTGVNINPKIVTPTIPENTATPIARRISAPAPFDNTSGTHTHDEGQRRHENRTQAQSAGLECCAHAVASLMFEFARKFHNQNCIFTRESYQHDESNLREDIVVPFGQPHATNRGQQSHGNDENDCEWQRPAFILRRQHEKREQYTQREDEKCRVATQNLLIREFRPFELHTVG